MVEPIRDLESSTDEMVKPRQMNIDTDCSLDTITRTPGRKIYADHPTNNIIIGQKTIHKDLMMPPRTIYSSSAAFLERLFLRLWRRLGAFFLLLRRFEERRLADFLFGAALRREARRLLGAMCNNITSP